MGLGITTAQMSDHQDNVWVATPDLPNLPHIIGMAQPVGLGHMECYPGATLIHNFQNRVRQKLEDARFQMSVTGLAVVTDE